ncbi:Transcription factor E2FB [Dendrobium catenatum]|uniref:Transcription factor E2FB n=1 Tax=Dendrobium catenatum TaxID=906689 RepID=A0A2I0WUI6_9ASPA|nr:Transcription factor E2FB [Dendrobium catenatum]
MEILPNSSPQKAINEGQLAVQNQKPNSPKQQLKRQKKATKPASKSHGFSQEKSYGFSTGSEIPTGTSNLQKVATVPAQSIRYLWTKQPMAADKDPSAEVENLALQECNLDVQINEMRERIRELSEDENSSKWLYVTEEDIKQLPCFQNQTLIAIKAPHGTTLEVPDPDEAGENPQRRYTMVLRSTMGQIDVYLVSKFEGTFEELISVDTSSNLPCTSSSGCNEHPDAPTLTDHSKGNELELQVHEDHDSWRINADSNATQDFTDGMMKVVPPDANVSAVPYFLRGNYQLDVIFLSHICVV